MVGGGAASRITGGKFATGAATAAYGYLYNDLVHPTNTLEAGIRQAILKGDVEELKLLLGQANLSANDMAIAQRALSMMESVGGENASMLAERYGVDWANKVDHIFNSVREGPIKDALLNTFKSPAEAVAEIQRALNAAKPAGNFFTGRFETNVNVQGINVTVRGIVKDGLPKISTILKQP
jgi:filamentous hemagglutinin